MKKFNYILILVLLALTTASIAAPRGVIQTKAVTPNTLTQFTTNSISNGLTTIAKGTYSYLAPFNFGDTSTISSVVWSFTSKPTGSNASLTNLANKWATFLADTNGTYVVNLHMVTSTGSHDTSITITASYYVGVGNFEGVAAIWPQCMSCHSNYPEFVSIFNTWKVTPHAKIFQEQLVIAPPAGHYSTSCTPCHTTGTDNKVVANNGGFDDVAKQLGWTFASTTGQWDTIKNKYPGLVNFATIGCENCHGAGKEHGSTGLVNKIAISLDAGLCQSCHDAPWRHAKGTLWNASMHSTSIWESGFAKNVTSTTYTLNDCIKCHDGQAFIAFTKGQPIDASKFTAANHTVISCATCHDPHVDVAGTYHLRNEPVSSDTLGNKFNYAGMGGNGKICMNCHKARRDNVSYMNTAISSTWGPHHNPQADNFFGQNAAQFGTQPYISNGHKDAITDACATCHMASSTTTDTLYKYQVGGHSTNMHYSGLTSIGTTVDYDHTLGCQSCHGASKTKFSDWQASMDYDGNGTIEDIQTEVKGCLAKIVALLPNNATHDTIDWKNITTPTQKKAYWNYQLIAYDGSYGMHNAKFAFDVLTKTMSALGSTTPVELVSFNAAITSNNVSLTWQTATETNNKGFDIEKMSGSTWVKAGFVSGKGTTSETNNYSFTDKVSGSGKISYRLKQIDFGGKVSYSKVVEVSYTGPGAYSLSQNYPNPFNPSTTIKFALPFDSNVKLTVYNVTGQVVKVLSNGMLSAGEHNVVFNFNESGVKISSGIYFYTLEASATNSNSTFRETKKMVLMK
jgi:hypothetical protein